MPVLSLREQYNNMLERYNKATEYIENDSIPWEERNQWIPEFHKVVNKLDDLIELIQAQENRKMTCKEILGGFHDMQ